MISSWYLLAVLVLGVLGWGYAYGDDNCYHDFQVTTDKQMYKPGDIVVMKIKSAFANCEPKDAPFLLTIINQTSGASDVIYQKMLDYKPGGMFFNYTLPHESSLPIFQRYLIKTQANSTSGPAEANWNIVVKENAPDQKYDFQIWPFQSAVTRGSNVSIMAQLCPIPDTDQGLESIVDKKTGLIVSPVPEVLVNYYFTAPNGTQIIRQDHVGNAECYNSQASVNLFSNTTGTWSVYAVAKWIENNSTHSVQSNSTSFVIKEPLTSSFEAKKIFDLKTANQTHIPMSDINQNKYGYSYGQLDWSHDGKIILFTIGVNETVQFWTLDPGTKEFQAYDLPHNIQSVSNPRISPSGNSIIFIGSHKIDTNNSIPDLFRYDIKDQKLVQITNDTAYDEVLSAIWTPDGNIIYSKSHTLKFIDNSSPTELWLADNKGDKIKKIYEEPRLFQIFDQSIDGKILISDKRVLDMDTLKTTVIENLQSDSLWGARFTPGQSLFIYSPSGGYGIGGYIYLQSTNGYNQILYYSKDPTPSSPVMSPDGRFVAFVSNYGSSDSIKGIYLLELAKPVPEFPLAEIVLLASITSLIAIYRIKIRK